MQSLRIFFLLLWISAKRFYLENYTYSASALAFTTVLSIVPLASVILSLIAVFPVFDKVIHLAQGYIISNFLPGFGSKLQAYLITFTVQASHLPGIGIVFLFVTATSMILTVENTFNTIWHTKKRKKGFLEWLLYWSVLICIPLVIGVSLLLSTLLFSLPWINSSYLFILKPSLLIFLSFAINTTLFSLLYIILPNFNATVRQGFVSGLLAASLFEISKRLFAWYTHQFVTYELIYGTLSLIPIFLLWVYLAWMIVLYGGLFTHEQHKMEAKHKSPLKK
jgi:membrane protein